VRVPSRDTASDAAFLDTLRLMTMDSVVGRQLPVTAAAVPDAPRIAPPSAPSSAPGPTWDIDVDRYTTNDRVQYYIDYFRGRARGHFETYLERLGRWESLVRAKLRAARMPQDLVYLAVIESGMNPLAVSRRRAVGLWQFMAATGRRYGLVVDPWVDERRDPWRATDAAIRMLSELNDRFGSLYLAAAAYDAGPGKIQRGLKRYDFGPTQGNDLYFALADERFLRRETRDYVPKLIAAAVIAKEPEKWGFDHIERWEPLRWDSIEVNDAVGLDVVARLADTSTDAILELNPQFVRRVTPPNRPVWVRVPPGRADSTAARLAVLPPEHRVTFVEHAVARGETLGQIAVRYHVTVDLIVSANRGVKPRSLRPGQVLIVPTSGIAPSRWGYASHTAGSGHSARRALRRTPPVLLSSVARAGRKPASPARAPATATGARTVHIVRPGESPYTIARSFRVPLDALLQHNGLTRRSLIKPGQAIRIPS
jgi:membrane-bound lytic murein transglycosylase D